MISGFHKNEFTPAACPRVVMASVAALFALIGLGCGDVYRPVAQPIPLPPPDPSAFHFVVALSTNGPADPGSASRIDVSGDTSQGVFATGVAPVHAVLIPNGTRLYVANTGEDTVSANNTPTPTAAVTISLPGGSKPVFVHTTENGNVYVANSGNNTVSVINTTSNVVTATVPAGTRPIAMAELPNAQKLYVANQGSSDVTVINTVDNSVGKTIPLGAPPVWIVARSDSARIYALDASGTIYDVDTLSDSVTATVSSGGSGSNFLLYDSTANALLVANSGSDSLSILNAAVDPPAPRAAGPVPITPPSTAGYPCHTAPVPVSVTALADGRAYVASYQLDSGLICTQASVVDIATGLVKTTIPLSAQAVDAANPTGCASARFRVFTVASRGSTTSAFKVYVSQCDAGNVAVIDTFASPSGVSPHAADVFSASIAAPLSSFSPQQISISAAARIASTSITTYTYSLTSGSGLQAGTSVFITGMSDAGNNGVFLISSVDAQAGTFSVVNPSGMSTTSQSGAGIVMPPQNPVYLVAGP